MFDAADRQIVSDLYLSRTGLDFVEEVVERFGSRFGGSVQEHQAAAYIRDRFAALGFPVISCRPPRKHACVVRDWRATSRWPERPGSSRA